jgi:hypothetical protein
MIPKQNCKRRKICSNTWVKSSFFYFIVPTSLGGRGGEGEGLKKPRDGTDIHFIKLMLHVPASDRGTYRKEEPYSQIVLTVLLNFFPRTGSA